MATAISFLGMSDLNGVGWSTILLSNALTLVFITLLGSENTMISSRIAGIPDFVRPVI
jgi:hypothetical protein